MFYSSPAPTTPIHKGYTVVSINQVNITSHPNATTTTQDLHNTLPDLHELTDWDDCSVSDNDDPMDWDDCYTPVHEISPDNSDSDSDISFDWDDFDVSLETSSTTEEHDDFDLFGSIIAEEFPRVKLRPAATPEQMTAQTAALEKKQSEKELRSFDLAVSIVAQLRHQEILDIFKPIIIARSCGAE